MRDADIYTTELAATADVCPICEEPAGTYGPAELGYCRDCLGEGRYV